MSQSNSSTTSSSSGAGSISGGPSPIKRSDELAARGGRMKAHKTSSRLSGGGVGSGVGGAKVADEREDQTRELATTAKAAAASEKQKQQTAASAQTVPIQPTEAAQASKLVFGLNPRAHRPQLSSSFAKKLAPSEQQQNEESDRDRDRATEAPITSRFTNNLAAGAVSGRASQKSSSTSSLGSSASSTPTTGIQSSSSSSQPDKGPTKRSGPTVRASKYGNFYKPQDSAVTTKNQTSTDEQQVGSPTGKPITSMTKTTTTSDQKAAPTNSRQTATTSGPTSSSTNATRGSSKEPPATSGRATVGGTGSGVSSGAAASSNSTGVGRPNSVRSTSKSPDRSKQMARRKSFDEDISTIKIESSPAAAVQQQQCQLQQQQSKQAQQQRQQQQNPILKTRTQFNILPPPQLAIATTGKGSVVGYAKSRIYDRPVKQILANPPESTYSALDDRSGQIPASILSGFKPPKQVNVSKAREKWEGGEPFAKCKSRQRLAAQANKKLFPGTWSITSVVATQQLHLQQALAQSASSANHRSNPLETDPSVKVLTRGSVLERVQQFEKAPVGGPSSSSSGGGTGSVGGLSTDSLIIDNYDDLSLTRSSSVSRSSSSLSSTGSLGSDGSGAVQQQQQQQQAKGLDSSEPSSKQAQYKTLVSTIQQQQLQQASVDVASSTQPLRAAYVGATGAAPAQQRRLSLRRRSSLGGLSRSSTSESLIPKFYHPNGKPNTYEMEIRKRDIVACFDKFPERKAHIAPTSATGRKQFHQIALACGYSEYFKVPLQQFVVHKLETDPKLARMSASHQQQLARQRKTSTVALNTNGTSPPIRPLMKAASVDSTAPSSRPVATDSGAGSGESPPTGSAGKDKRDTAAALSQVTCEQFLACWRDLISHAYDNAAQFIHLLTLGQRNYLTPDDFVPLVQSIIDDHPGLKFLRAAPDFHMRYIQTVIARIYFNINRSWTGKITLQELRKSNLLAVLMVLGQEEDINQITDYFSYEHFYVIYCKFWNLDQDHDLFISKEDLARHNDAAISSRIIERIFSGIVSKQIQQTGRMSYSDFVWFLIAEEDKKHPRSVEYWFRLMDLDGDGYISMYEMEYFYYEQTKRLELMNIEALPFLDSACQILDLVNPREKNKISLADLKRTKMATIFFDTFINLEKYLEHESREFVSTRDIVQGGVVISDWDRYASEEYENLVTEESTV